MSKILNLLEATNHKFLLFNSSSDQKLMTFHSMLKSHRFDAKTILAYANECISAFRTVGKELHSEDAGNKAAADMEKANRSNPKNPTSRAREICDTCINLYTKESFLYREVNHRLRRVASVPDDKFESLIKAVGDACGQLSAYVFLLWEALHLVFASSSENVVTLYRGLRLSQSGFKIMCEHVGGYIVLPEFASFSLSLETALKFPTNVAALDKAKDVDVIYELDSFSRPAIQDLSKITDEQEVLMHPFSTFKVISTAKAGPNGRPVVRLCDVDVVRLREKPLHGSVVGLTPKAQAKAQPKAQPKAKPQPQPQPQPPAPSASKGKEDNGNKDEKKLLVKYSFEGAARMRPVPMTATLRQVIALLAEHAKAPIATLWDGEDELDLFEEPFADYFREEKRYLAKTLPHGVAPGTLLAEVEKGLRGIGVAFGREAEQFPEGFRDGIAPTLIVAKTDDGYVIGCYSPVPWPEVTRPWSIVSAPGAFSFKRWETHFTRYDACEIATIADRDAETFPYLRMSTRAGAGKDGEVGDGDAFDVNGYNYSGKVGSPDYSGFDRFEFWRL